MVLAPGRAPCPRTCSLRYTCRARLGTHAVLDKIEECWDEDEDEDEDEDDGVSKVDRACSNRSCIKEGLYKMKWRSKQTNFPPSPPKLPLIGNFHQLSKRSHHSLKDLSQKYGPIMLLHFGQVPIVVVSSSSLAEEIFKTHDADFSSRFPMTTAKIFMYGCVDIGFAPYNESRQLRKICVMELLSVRTVKTFKTVREEEVACLIERISRSSSKGASVDLPAMSHILTVHIIFRCALGRKLSNVDGQNRFADLPKELISGLSSFSFADSIPLFVWLDIVTGLITRLKKTARKLDSFLEQVIEELIIQSSSNDLDKAKDFMDVLLQIQED
ncbi:hypothetical protein Sjap_013248 [Stephania japonica]|uniref:Cytochrome P450 n=1 Tax=Stephania japonica TaxID=461633 RepID=A0AAP0J015_9MAGN